MNLTELPTDIVVLLFPYLNAADFLALTSCTSTFHSYRQDPTFWRDLTQRTFRIPPQPLLTDNGARWQWLYKSLLTQTHVFTWGNNDQSTLGHSFLVVPTATRRNMYNALARRIGWPTKMEYMEEVGVVSDVQCGGWSTVVLNSIGQLFAVGVLNGELFQMPCRRPTRFRFRAGYPPTTKSDYFPSTAIKQYSVGRCHVMGLSDSGEIWEWFEINMQAQLLSTTDLNLVIGRSETNEDRATRVVAGWSNSSAYINGRGIVYWRAAHLHHSEEGAQPPQIGTITIPGTSYRRGQPQRWQSSSSEASIGEVISHVVLEHHIVFYTHLNKVFAFHTDGTSHPPLPTELTTFSQPDPDFQIQDLQGSFKRFGIFTKAGQVLLGTADMLESCTSPSPPASLPEPLVPPALQSAQVISLAFGDHHYHALHANGTITSFGHEPYHCGCLGLGSPRLATFRGVTYHQNGDGIISTPVWSEGRRRVWFEPEKAFWLEYLHQEAGAENPSPQAVMARTNADARIAFGDWLEREGAAWSEGPQGQELTDGSPHASMTTRANTRDVSGPGIVGDPVSDRGAFFAVKITAAGWHSGALVLVDHDKAERVRQKWIVHPTSSTRELPSSAPAPASDTSAEPSPFPRHENIGGQEAEGEEVAAPSEQLVAGIMGIANWFWELGRWFLGLQARDATVDTVVDDGNTQRMAVLDHTETEEAEKGTMYVWNREGFPRIELPGGVMPGEGEVKSWKGERPNWGGQEDGGG